MFSQTPHTFHFVVYISWPVSSHMNVTFRKAYTNVHVFCLEIDVRSWKSHWYQCTFCWTLLCKRINTLRPRQNCRPFPDDFFKCIFLKENVKTAIKISLKFVPNGPMNNIPVFVQIMVCRRPGNKPLSEPMMVSSQTHICITRPHWVKLEIMFSSELSSSRLSKDSIYIIILQQIDLQSAPPSVHSYVYVCNEKMSPVSLISIIGERIP